jgi:hypothetical protein
MHKTCPRHAFALWLVPLLTLGLGACAQQPAQAPVAPAPPMIAPEGCNEAAAQFAIGKAADAKLIEEARVKSGAQRVRVIRPGQMVTMEYDARRLSLDLDEKGKVVGARCG